MIDFSFIHDRVSDLYCANNGRPALDPVLMFKALFIGYLFGVALRTPACARDRGQCRLSLVFAVEADRQMFDASTLSQNRRRRYHDASVAQDIFDEIVEQAIRHGLVDGKLGIITDSYATPANLHDSISLSRPF
ncbi:MAG: transposase [Pseudomonadota bacterium]